MWVLYLVFYKQVQYHHQEVGQGQGQGPEQDLVVV